MSNMIRNSYCILREPWVAQKCRTMFTHAIDDNLPRIKVPQRMVKKIEKVVKKQALAAAAVTPKKHRGKVVVDCKRKQYNHHLGQEYSDFSPHMLASHGWKHKRSPGDHFTIKSFAPNPAHRDMENQTFEELRLRAEVVESVKATGLQEPTKIQAEAIPEVREGNNTLFAAETGSGKTLAYLLPVIESLLYQREHLNIEDTIRSPQAVILAPSRELVLQITDVAEKLASPLSLNVACLKGGRRLRNQCAAKRVDILVATPGVLRKVLAADLYSISRAQHLVIDECDTLLDDSFNGLTKYIMRKMQIQSTLRTGVIGDGAQLIMVGATIPKDLDNILRDLVPIESVVKVTTPYLHRIMPHIHQKFLRLSSIQKPPEMLSIAKSSTRASMPTMVFCNQSSTSTWLHRFLDENGVESLLMQGALYEEDRRHIFNSFKEGDGQILISTDIASRGLDTTHVQRVVNYDFPLYMSDYIHRVGRVGRVGSKRVGHVTNFITHKWDVDLVWKIETAVRKMSELHDVNANIKRTLEERSSHEDDSDGS